MKVATVLVLAAALALVAGCANPERSRDLANPKIAAVTLAQQVCVNCHGANGNSISPNFPKLAGQMAPYIVAQLNGFKSHDRHDPAGFEYMWGLSRSLTDEQIKGHTSAAPGKTRLANVYRVTRGGGAPFYLLDLPGYGYARAPKQARGAASPAEGRRASQEEFEAIVRAVFERAPAGLLLVDARHPGLASDRAAWQWIHGAAGNAAVAATKIDKLGRGERIRALRDLESVFETSVLPVSAVTGEGLDELWTLIDRILSNRHPRHSRPPLPRATAPPPLPHRKS